MNLDEQKLNGQSVIHILDALNAGLLNLKISRNSYTLPMTNDLIIYIDKQDRNNPTSERREYVFSLSKQLVYLYESDVRQGSDEFNMELKVKDNEVFMQTYVVRKIENINGVNTFAVNPEIEELESTPIVLFEGENYIYTNYDADGMTISLTYPKNTDLNKMFLNNAIYYNHNEKKDGEFSLDDIYFKDAFTKTGDKLNLSVDNAEIESLTSKNNTFSLDEDGNLMVNSITCVEEQNTGITLNDVYPVGSIYMSVNSTNPTSLFGGTWIAWGSGRVPVGVDTSQTEFNTVNKVGGEKTHLLTTTEIPSHSHTTTTTGAHTHTYTGFIQSAVTNNANYTSIAHKRFESDGTATPPSMNSSGGHTHTISNTGGSGSHNNLQPYITCYMWRRTA